MTCNHKDAVVSAPHEDTGIRHRLFQHGSSQNNIVGHGDSTFLLDSGEAFSERVPARLACPVSSKPADDSKESTIPIRLPRLERALMSLLLPLALGLARRLVGSNDSPKYNRLRAQKRVSFGYFALFDR